MSTSLKDMTADQYWAEHLEAFERTIQRIPDLPALHDYIQSCCTSLVKADMPYVQVRDLEGLMLAHLRLKYIDRFQLEVAPVSTLKGPYTTKISGSISAPSSPKKSIHKGSASGTSSPVSTRVLVETDYTHWLRLVYKINAYNDRAREGGSRGPIDLHRLL